MRYGFINGAVFDGEAIRHNLTVVVEGEQIVDVSHQASSVEVDTVIDLKGRLLVPGFIDLQVNGGGGVLFNSQPDLTGLKAMFAAHRRYGTTSMLPTLISDRFEVMASAVGAVARARETGLPGILGIHLEGPYLSREKCGVHTAEVLRQPDAGLTELLATLPPGSRTVLTVAPEAVTPEWISSQVAAGALVAIGHSNASAERVEQALTAGADGFTHLFNAMSQLNARMPGVVGAALADEHSWCGVIVDGFHVHPTALKIALKAKPPGRVLLVTDAVHTVGVDGERFRLCGQMIVRREGRVTTENGTLAGSDLTMIQAVRNAVALLEVPLEEALRMASLYPARALGIDGGLGRIAAGYQADMLVLGPGLEVQQSWIKGEGQCYDSPAV